MGDVLDVAEGGYLDGMEAGEGWSADWDVVWAGGVVED